LLQGLDNRWLIKLSSEEAASHLVREGFHLYNRHIIVCHYDDVLQQEYDEYQEFLAHEKRLQLMRQGLQDVALGLAEDVEEDPTIAADSRLGLD